MPRQLTIAQWKKAQEIGATHYQSGRCIDLLKKEGEQWHGWLVEADGSDMPTKNGHTGWTELSEDDLIRDKLFLIDSQEQLEKTILDAISIEIALKTAPYGIPADVAGDMIEAAMNAFKAANLL